MASSKRTVSRRLFAQYAPSIAAVSNQPPVTVDQIGIVPDTGAMPANSATISDRISSTCAECDA